MATKRPYTNSAYGLSEPLINVAQAPIVAKRNPVSSDRAEVGTTWVNESTNQSFVLTSVVDNQATWVETDGSSAATVFDGNTGSATPSGGVLNITGGTGITTTASGNTVSIAVTGAEASSFQADTGTAAPVAGVMIMAGAGDVATSATGNTVTFTGSGVTTVDGDTGSATASSNTVTIAGGTGITTSATGSTVTITASGGGGGIATLDGDTGSATGATVTIDTGYVTGPLANGTPSFSGSASTLTLRFDDLDSNLGIGAGALSSSVSPTASQNVAIGTGSGALLTIGTGNTLVGYEAGNQVTTGINNVFIGANVGNGSTITGNGNIVTGVGGGASTFTTATNNVDIGGNLGITTGALNITIGNNSGSNYTTSESSNINLNGVGVAAESNVLRIGAATGTGTQQLSAAFICGIDGVDLSTAEVVTMASNQLGSTTLTAGSGISITPGSGTVTIAATGGGGGITTLDGDSGSATGATVTITGGGASHIGTASFTATGATVTLNPNPLTTGNTGSTGWGPGALANIAGSLFTPVNSSAFGTNAGNSVTTGNGNCAFGSNSLSNTNTGSFNSAFGFNTLEGLDTGSSNCAFGNSALGSFSGTASASFNIGIGDSAGFALRTTESSNIYLNSVGVISESNALRIGAATGTGTQQLNSAFIAGIQGITVTGTAVLVSSSDQLGIAVSSRRFKSDIQDMKDGSSALYKLRPVSFVWDKDSTPGLKDATDLRQYGLIAEEAASIIPHAVNLDKEGKPLNINYPDLIGMMINEIQKLRKEVDALKKA